MNRRPEQPRGTLDDEAAIAPSSNEETLPMAGYMRLANSINGSGDMRRRKRGLVGAVHRLERVSRQRRTTRGPIFFATATEEAAA